ncbi:MAG: Shikimate dehydrogenase (NADP(+)) [Phycisphaerales bacterium]|nr:Shikimate dehydrogenase (NADP(+)) [Phycisphaerales bacterium]
MTLVCVPIMMRDVDSALADATAAANLGADLVEFRVDEFFTGGAEAEAQTRAIMELVSSCPVAAIVTCRHSSEGGSYDGDEEDRVELYRALAAATGPGRHPPRYLDFELERYAASNARRAEVNAAVDAERTRTSFDALGGEEKPTLILSNHDFQGRPADLARRVIRMRAEAAAGVLKIAYRARSLRDNLELFDLLSERDRPMIALGMGEFGLISRLLAPKFGGFLTFAALRPAATTAPGQPTVRELVDTYRFRSINRRTKVYGIAGWPVGHSKSPLVHNAGFEATRFNGVYVPLPIAVAEGDAADAQSSYASFKATLLALAEHPRLDLSGLSVTIPHKENLVRLGREQGWDLDELSGLCGAANTMVIDRDERGGVARVRILNTDAPAAISCLEERIGSLRGKVVGVLGAGGVARAIVFALARAGATVRVCNRSAARAEELAAAAARATGADVRGHELSSDIVSSMAATTAAWVNCTPIGMAGGPDPAGSPIEFKPGSGPGAGALSNFPAGTAVLDTVYNPARTPLLEAAQAAGLVTIDGVSMFVRQAEAQFSAWTGTNAPPGLFERTVRDALGA